MLLYLFVASLAFTLVFHSVKLSYRLASEKGALTLAILVLVKAVLLGFDIATLSYLLYEMLVVNGTSLLNPGNSNVAMMVSIAGPSPLVSLLTNSLVNVPLYYCFLRMKMRGKRDVKTMQSGESIGVWRVVRASVAKSMHPLVSSIFGSYQIYAVVAMLVCYNSVYGSVNWIGVPGTSTYATFNSMFWINLIVNYFPGALVSTFYWLEVVVCGLFGNSSKQ